VTKLQGVEIDTKKSVVMVAVELREPEGFGRIRLRRVADASEASVLPFVCDSVEPGSTIHTDGSWAYRSLHKHGYIRNKTVLLGSEKPAHVSLPGVHRVAALLKRWLLGTHQGSVQPHHLDYYLDEYTFRFNRRTSRSPGLLFYRLLEQAVMTDPVTYKNLVGPPSGPQDVVVGGAKCIALLNEQLMGEVAVPNPAIYTSVILTARQPWNLRPNADG
jgi:transposase-like protein